ncbi:hypothetical protein GGTG_07668 [Gaeumannomyces tritici R3-111a-1]|uniref:Uncharacterized protein n=1 Tax=Gaeumannomyces tritici (strain R3-111a-1) TaxID=644352 RepID=J3P2C1_GAET3|nr:hypothetical protein GGTG_07668 [Gaeumannomyces tritici R3-111a-1]EJT73813.1 hypothetical protein GGTG_07668 [Gaeumannomyces tritici R3-111a-1]
MVHLKNVALLALAASIASAAPVVKNSVRSVRSERLQDVERFGHASGARGPHRLPKGMWPGWQDGAPPPSANSGGDGAHAAVSSAGPGSSSAQADPYHSRGTGGGGGGDGVAATKAKASGTTTASGPRATATAAGGVYPPFGASPTQLPGASSSSDRGQRDSGPLAPNPMYNADRGSDVGGEAGVSVGDEGVVQEVDATTAGAGDWY